MLMPDLGILNWSQCHRSFLTVLWGTKATWQGRTAKSIKLLYCFIRLLSLSACVSYRDCNFCEVGGIVFCKWTVPVLSPWLGLLRVIKIQLYSLFFCAVTKYSKIVPFGQLNIMTRTEAGVPWCIKTLGCSHAFYALSWIFQQSTQ